MEQASVAGMRARSVSTAGVRVEHAVAPFALRCGALLIDYALVVGSLAFATLMARMFDGGARSSGDAIEMLGYLLAGVIGVLNFVALPATTGRSCGKWATGLRISRRGDAGKPGVARVLLRHVVGYPLSLLVFGLGFLLAIFDREGRALHDRIGGTIVVRDAAAPSARS